MERFAGNKYPLTMDREKFMSLPGVGFRAQLVGAWCCSNTAELKGRPHPESVNSQMKESLRETRKRISPKYDSADQ